MIHLESVRKKGQTGDLGKFPFSVPIIKHLEPVDLASPVTFFVGENGSGKSTLLKAMALAANLPFVGAEEGIRDPSEDFFGFQRRLARDRVELTKRLDEIEVEYSDRSDLARGLARGPIAGSLREMERRYGIDPDARSHGEAFLALFQSRFVPESLVLLDEPEAALSPQNQLGLVALILAMVEQGAQFVVATHSPIVLAVPGARILSFDQGAIRPAGYNDLDHVRITRDFLNDPDRYLRQL